ncbi:MAG: type II toxin-antitoxin system RelE/ParE family toxin [Aliidongia sp.]
MVHSSPEIKILPATFYRTEPVRDWLKHELSKDDRIKVGTAIKRVELEWPIGKPICAPLSDGLWEGRVNLPNRIARVIFCVHDETMVLLHGFIKKAQQTPKDDFDFAGKRKRDVEKASAEARK